MIRDAEVVDVSGKFDPTKTERPAAERTTVFEWLNEEHPEWKAEVVRVVPKLYKGMAEYFKRYGVEAEEFNWGMLAVEKLKEEDKKAGVFSGARTWLNSGEMVLNAEIENVADLIRVQTHELVHFFSSRQEIQERGLWMQKKDKFVFGLIESEWGEESQFFAMLNEAIVESTARELGRKLTPEYWLGDETSYENNIALMRAVCTGVWSASSDSFRGSMEVYGLMQAAMFDRKKAGELRKMIEKTYGDEMIKIEKSLAEVSEGAFVKKKDKELVEMLANPGKIKLASETRRHVA